MAHKEYKILHIAEGGIGTIILGASGLPLKKLETILKLVFQLVEQKRFMLFTPLSFMGILTIAAITIVELYALFKSQTIVQAHNNRIMEQIYRDLTRK